MIDSYCKFKVTNTKLKRGKKKYSSNGFKKAKKINYHCNYFSKKCLRLNTTI